MSFHDISIRRRALLAALSGMALMPALSACNASGDGDGLTKITIGYQPATDYGLFYVGKEKGWFEEAGVDVELTLFTAGDAQIEALANNSTDMSLQGAQPALIAVQKGVADLRLIAPIADSGSLFSIVADSSISTVEELTGKKLAFQVGSAYEYYVDNVLASYDMTQADVEVVNLNPLDGQGAFLSKNVDAVVPLATSRYTILESRADANVIFTPEDFENAPSPRVFSVYDLMIVNGASMEEKRPAIEAVVKTYLEKIVPYVTSEDTREQCVEDLVRWQRDVAKAETDAETIRQLLAAYGFYDAEEAKAVIAGGEFMEQVEGQAKFLVTAGTLDDMPDLDTMIDDSVIGAA